VKYCSQAVHSSSGYDFDYQQQQPPHQRSSAVLWQAVGQLDERTDADVALSDSLMLNASQ